MKRSEPPEGRRPASAADAGVVVRERHRLRGQIEILQLIFDRSPVMISCFDPAGRLIFANREWERVMGWTLEEARQTHTLAEAYPDPEGRRRATEMLPEEQPGWANHRARTRDGKIIEISWTRSALSDGSQLVLGLDLSESRRAEQSVRESETRFRAIFEGALDAILIIDEDGCFIDANPAACALLGRDHEAILRLRVSEITVGGYDFDDALQQLLRRGTLEGEWAFLRSDGSPLKVEFAARAHFVPGQHLGVLRDITERKRLETALKTSEVYLNEGQRLSHTGSWAWNVGTGELFWSAETCRIFGLDSPRTSPSHELFLGRLHPEDAARVNAEIAQAVREGTDFESRYRIVGPGGAQRHLHSLGHPTFDEAGTVREFVGVVSDVTDQRVAEERLRRSHDEIRALAGWLRLAREEEGRRIARNVHDEVGQALTALHMDTAFLERRLAQLPGSATETLLEKVASMSALISTTLESVQRIATELRPGVLDELGLEAAVEWYARDFQKRAGIACRMSATVEAERLSPDRSTAAFRILQEALTNVSRHSGAASVDVRLRCDAGGLRLEVRDDGRGIAAEKLDDSRSLGLVGMRERARALGGEVAVWSAPGKGTRVQLSFPP